MIYSFGWLLLFGLFVESNLSVINDDDNQHQVATESPLVNQTASTILLNNTSLNLHWIKSLKNLTLNAGLTVVLECQVQSSYSVVFNWYRYNNLLDRTRFIVDSDSFRSSLIIKNLKETHAGFYTCEVSNGFQTITSTGFVRVQNREIDPIDTDDDSLPSIDFMSNSMEKNVQSIERLQCEIYSGNVCRSVLGSSYVSMTNVKQNDIEENFLEHLKILSDECRLFLLPMICLFIYPMCDHDQKHIRSICRQSCFYFESHPCMKGLSSGYLAQTPQSTFRSVHQIPTCKSLPPASDEMTCLQIDPLEIVSSSSPNRSSSRPSAIFNSSLSVVLSICLPIGFISMLLLFCCLYYSRHRRSKAKPLIKSTLSHRLPSYPSSPLDPVPNQQLLTHPVLSSSSSSTQTHLTHLTIHQYNHAENQRSGQISAENIRFLEEIGQGEFGRIYLGEFIDNQQKCLVKCLQIEEETDEYLREIERFRSLHHPNMSCLLGVCLQSHNTYSFMIYEYLNNGTLHDFIVEHAPTLNLKDFLQFAIQITSGMIYLSARHFQHNDLAMRNILISQYGTVKITNIARYCPKYDLDYYRIANRLLPVRWMSVESLISGIYTEQTDIWSFGVLLWEMFSFGVQPYFGYTNPEVIERVRDRKLLFSPINCPTRIYTMMCSCWQEVSERRPTFVELFDQLKLWNEKLTSCSRNNDGLSWLNDFQAPIARAETLSRTIDRSRPHCFK